MATYEIVTASGRGAHLGSRTHPGTALCQRPVLQRTGRTVDSKALGRLQLCVTCGKALASFTQGRKAA